MIEKEAIQERSYLIWEQEGRPHGRHLDHWLQAEAELRSELQFGPKSAPKKQTLMSASDSDPAPNAAKAEKKSAKPAARKRAAPANA